MSAEYAPSPDSTMSEIPAAEYAPPSPESPPPPEADQLRNKSGDFGSDIMLWRRKKLNVVILGVATAIWILMEVYQYNLITLISWALMAFLTCCFFWGNMHRFLKREAPELSELEIKEETVMEHARLFKQGAEQVIRLMLHVSGQRDWFVFAAVVTCLYVISVVAAHLDFLTISYIGIVGGLTVPVIYVNKEEKMREVGQRLKIKSQRLHAIMEDKLRIMKSKIVGRQQQQQVEEIKDKKQE